MHTPRNRSGLTLVEILVVITIICMLMALTMPSVERSREAARRATCMGHQMNITLAMLNYESSHRRFPGHVNRLGDGAKGETIPASWVVPTFAYLEQMELWKAWNEGRAKHAFLRLLTCPSDPPEQVQGDSTPLSYVANCGRPGDEDTAADGVFHNHNVDTEPVLVTLDYLGKHDGATHTLMFSENVQAGNWTDTEEANIGMVWREKPEQCSSINECVEAGDRPQDIQYARPSSRHGAGVVVSFRDGHQEFLREDIDYNVYQHLMTPDSKAAGVPGEFDPNKL